MSNKLLYVPTTRPRTPTAINNKFRITTTLNRPRLSGHRTHISMIAGNAMPSTDKHNAPNNEMNSARRGTDIARKTEKKKSKMMIT